MVTASVHPIHFDDYSGVQFERLVFAYHVRAGWTNLVWHGQVGADKGRDIIGTEEFDDEPSRRTVIQCVNRRTLTTAKAKEDMSKALKASTGKPDAFKFVCGGKVSDATRAAVSTAAAKFSIDHVTIWSGVEFEENLRLRGEYLLRRFVLGEPFPETESEIRRFVDDFPDLSDNEALALMAAVFDRPAFRTPFHLESSLPAFQQAIEDTIKALNTGIWRTREGVEIRRIPSVNNLKDRRVRRTMVQVVNQVDELRRIFVRHLREGGISHCGCGDPKCPVFLLARPGVARELDVARRRALETFRSIYPDFHVVLR